MRADRLGGKARCQNPTCSNTSIAFLKIPPAPIDFFSAILFSICHLGVTLRAQEQFLGLSIQPTYVQLVIGIPITLLKTAPQGIQSLGNSRH